MDLTMTEATGTIGAAVTWFTRHKPIGATAGACGDGGGHEMTFGFNNSIAWLPVIALAWVAWFALVVVPNLVRRNAA